MIFNVNMGLIRIIGGLLRRHVNHQPPLLISITILVLVIIENRFTVSR